MATHDPNDPVGIDEGFLGRTYRSTALLTAVVALYLWRYGQAWAIFPVALGAAVGLGMFYLSEVAVRRIFRGPAPGEAAPSTEPGQKKFRAHLAGRALFALALIKYVLAGLLLWFLVRHWDMMRLAAFVGGFCLVHIGIVLRAFSRLLIAGLNPPPTDKRDGM